MSERNPDESLHGKISSQHRRLDEMFEELRATLRPQKGASEADPAASEICAKMREEVDAHFELEERLYYPSIWALRPELEAPLGALLLRHTHFLTQLEEIAGALQAGALDHAEALFASFAADFALHEEAEEHILHDLEQSL